MATAKLATLRMNRLATKLQKRETSASTETFAFQKIYANRSTELLRISQWDIATKMLPVSPRQQILREHLLLAVAFVCALILPQFELHYLLCLDY